MVHCWSFSILYSGLNTPALNLLRSLLLLFCHIMNENAVLCSSVCCMTVAILAVVLVQDQAHPIRVYVS